MPDHQDPRSATRPAPDSLLVDIAEYVLNKKVANEDAFTTAHYCLIDSLACALLALKQPACKKLLGPVVAGGEMKGGARVPGTGFELDPVQAAFNIGVMIRWLDFNDTWLAAEWGHPSDNLGAILAVADYINRSSATISATTSATNSTTTDFRPPPLLVRDVLTALIKAYEIQGILALENSFNRVGLDHVILVRVASTAVTTAMLGGTKDQIINALSNAWIDGGALRTYRHAPNTGSRKSWAAGDATSRGVRLALMAIKDEMGYPSALSAKTWGFSDVLFNNQPLTLAQPLDSYVIENILFKITYPAEFHAQTAVEAAMQLHNEVKDRLDDIEKIVIETQQAGIRIIDKTGPLDNPADRDHCMQYMVAIPLIFGRLTANDYEDATASDARIDTLRDKMTVQERLQYSKDYLDPAKRSIANAIQIFFNDGSHSDRIEVQYPIGHRKRRKDALPLLMKKVDSSLSAHYKSTQRDKIFDLFGQINKLEIMPIDALLTLLATD